MKSWTASFNMLLFDTYALLEIIEGNPNYEKFTDRKIIINNFIFAELCYTLTKWNHPQKSYYTKRLKEQIKSINPNTIINAMKFRYRNKKKKLSTTDFLSYLMAQELGIKFLTGDKEFKNMKGVEFVK